jgi:lipid A 3-O-deacylase
MAKARAGDNFSPWSCISYELPNTPSPPARSDDAGWHGPCFAEDPTVKEIASVLLVAVLLIPVQTLRAQEKPDDLMISVPPLIPTVPSAPAHPVPLIPEMPGQSQAEFLAPSMMTGDEVSAEVMEEDPFTRGRWSFEVNGGCYFSQPGIGPRTPTFDFAPINLRLGLMLTNPCFPGWMHGNCEALVEFSTAPIVDGFGDIVVGPTALLRYNWVQPGRRWVPYLQGGAGFVYNNAFEDRSQRAIGEAVEFALKAAVGCHFFVRDNLSLDIEGGYIHISNADLASRNLGINAVGGSLGITLYLPCGR